METVNFKFDTMKSSPAYDDYPGWRCDLGEFDESSDNKIIACCGEDDAVGFPKSCINSKKSIVFNPNMGLLKGIKVGSGFETRCSKLEKDGTRVCKLESDINGPVLSDSEREDQLETLSKTKRIGL